MEMGHRLQREAFEITAGRLPEKYNMGQALRQAPQAPQGQALRRLQRPLQGYTFASKEDSREGGSTTPFCLPRAASRLFTFFQGRPSETAPLAPWRQAGFTHLGEPHPTPAGASHATHTSHANPLPRGSQYKRVLEY